MAHLHPSGGCQGWRDCAAPAWHTTAPSTLQTASGQGAAPALPKGRTPPPQSSQAFLGSGHYWERLGDPSSKDQHATGQGTPFEGWKESCRTVQRLEYQPVSCIHCKCPRQLSATPSATSHHSYPLLLSLRSPSSLAQLCSPAPDWHLLKHDISPKCLSRIPFLSQRSERLKDPPPA